MSNRSLAEQLKEFKFWPALTRPKLPPEKWYSTSQWQRIKDAFRKRHPDRRCQGILPGGTRCKAEGTTLDHINPFGARAQRAGETRDPWDLFTDEKNLQYLCDACDARKKFADNEKRLRAQYLNAPEWRIQEMIVLVKDLGENRRIAKQLAKRDLEKIEKERG